MGRVQKVKWEPKIELVKSEPESGFVETTISHPKDRLKIKKKKKKIADGNSAALLNDFPFDPKEFLEKPLTF